MIEVLDPNPQFEILPENDEELRIFQQYGIPTDRVCPEFGRPLDKVCPQPFSTLLDTKETSDVFTESVSWRQASGRFNDPTYARVLEAYAQLDHQAGSNRERQLLNCHTLAYFARHQETGEVKIISQKCNLRWCPVCQKSKQAWITHEVSNWLRMFKHPKILTLTQVHTDAPLAEQVSMLYRNFQNLRKRKFFKSKVTGGVWFFQIKKSKTDGLWHPHIHCLITGFFLPREKLSALWLKITGDSPVCDIRAVKDPDSAVRHVARYATSPCDLSNLSTPAIREIIQALHGRRIVGTWGLAKSIHLQVKPKTDKDSWQNVGDWWEVLRNKDSDPQAKAILRAWKLNEPLPAGINMLHLSQLISEGFASLANPPPIQYLTNFYN